MSEGGGEGVRMWRVEDRIVRKMRDEANEEELEDI